MSIYAKTSMGTMPGSCTECKLGERYGCVGDVKCRVLNDYFTGNVEPPYKERPEACPLREMNPDGKRMDTYDQHLLEALDTLAEKLEKQAKPDPIAVALLGALNPTLVSAISEAGTKDHSTVLRVRARLVELLKEEGTE